MVAGTVIFGIKAVIPIRHSLADGLLSAFLTNDDVGHLFDALHHTAVLRSDGILALIKGLIDGPPHSPTLTLIGAVSFALSGAASFAPYLANGLLLGAVLGLLVHRLSVPLAPSVGILICVALLPLRAAFLAKAHQRFA
jgi:hypothetical protein